MTQQRAPAIQTFLDRLIETVPGITVEFADASDHPYTCRCHICRNWWLSMGPDPDTNKFGPFGTELQEEYEQQMKEVH